MKNPNILFLFSDQHNARCMSCAGHPDVSTPNIDNIAKEGVKFDNAYANNPICTPSRMSFLSGLYPSTHGYFGLYGPEPQENITSIFKYLKGNGYRTGAMGKLHTPRFWIERDCQFIYDEFIEYPKYLEGAGLYNLNDNRPFTGHRSGEASYIPFEHSCEMALAKQAIRFIKNEGEPKDRGESGSPWFAWVSFSRPHEPYTPSEPFASMYPPEKVHLPPVNKNEKEEVKKARESWGEDRLRKYLSSYLGLVSQMDFAIGEILKYLKDTGELENTIIIYSSDHGDYAGEHGLIGKRGGISYGATTHIPLIVRLPQTKHKGMEVKDIVESVDVFPTICELVGLDIPNTVQGLSFKGLLEGGRSWLKECALIENVYRKAIVTKEWRYVANIRGQQADELYDIINDPWEIDNKIDNIDCSKTAAEMLRLLLDRQIKARKPINTMNGDWYNHVYDMDGRVDMLRCGSVNEGW